MNPEAHLPLYEFEAALESGFRKLFEAQGFTVNTPDDFDYQRATPRVDIHVISGAATDHRSTHDEFLRCDSFAGTLQVTTLTLISPGVNDPSAEATNSNAYRLHSKMRAKVRYLLGRCERDFTLRRTTGPDDWLPYHDINRCFPQGDEPVMKGDDGALSTTSRYELHFNIRPAKWPADD